jgi:hypothetical protein
MQEVRDETVSDGGRYTQPKRSGGDLAHAGARAILGAIPYAGQAAIEFLNVIMLPPLERRRAAWYEEIGRRLRELDEKGVITYEDLADNEPFISTVMQATQAAMRNHQEEKLETLRNAVLNAALPCPPDESMQQMYLTWVEDLTVWHLRLMCLLSAPRDWFQRNNVKPPVFYQTSSVAKVIEHAFPDLASNRPLTEHLMRDLHSRGLLNVREMNLAMSADGAMHGHATPIGGSFFRFISTPKDLPSGGDANPSGATAES